MLICGVVSFFFFQAEDGIRDDLVTGVQTCALPIADERWLRGWEVDMQLMTELLAAERRHGGTFGGVIIEGLIKGRRMPEKNSVGDVTGYRDTTPLLYGYKCDADPPLVRQEYAYEYTRRKGWYRFPVWKESFPIVASRMPAGQYAVGQTFDITLMSSLEYWINWLPEEVVEAQFTIVPPIMRDEARIESKVRQIVAIERDICTGTEACEDTGAIETLDNGVPQNEQSCVYPSGCSM